VRVKFWIFCPISLSNDWWMLVDLFRLKILIARPREFLVVCLSAICLYLLFIGYLFVYLWRFRVRLVHTW